MTKRVLTPGCKDWSVIQMQRATLFAESVVVLVDSEKLWCAVSSPLSLSSVDVDDTDLRQKEGPVISFPLYRCCPDAVSIPLYSLVSCTTQFTQTKHSIDMIHTCSRRLVVKPGGKECMKYLVNEKTTDLHPQNLQKGQVAQSYKPYLAHLRLHFNYNISTKHPVFIDHTKLNPNKGVTTELIAITHSHVLLKVK